MDKDYFYYLGSCVKAKVFKFEAESGWINCGIVKPRAMNDDIGAGSKVYIGKRAMIGVHNLARIALKHGWELYCDEYGVGKSISFGELEQEVRLIAVRYRRAQRRDRFKEEVLRNVDGNVCVEDRERISRVLGIYDFGSGFNWHKNVKIREFQDRMIASQHLVNSWAVIFIYYVYMFNGMSLLRTMDYLNSDMGREEVRKVFGDERFLGAPWFSVYDLFLCLLQCWLFREGLEKCLSSNWKTSGKGNWIDGRRIALRFILQGRTGKFGYVLVDRRCDAEGVLSVKSENWIWCCYRRMEETGYISGCGYFRFASKHHDRMMYYPLDWQKEVLDIRGDSAWGWEDVMAEAVAKGMEHDLMSEHFMGAKRRSARYFLFKREARGVRVFRNYLFASKVYGDYRIGKDGRTMEYLTPSGEILARPSWKDGEYVKWGISAERWKKVLYWVKKFLKNRKNGFWSVCVASGRWSVEKYIKESQDGFWRVRRFDMPVYWWRKYFKDCDFLRAEVHEGYAKKEERVKELMELGERIRGDGGHRVYQKGEEREANRLTKAMLY